MAEVSGTIQVLFPEASCLLFLDECLFVILSHLIGEKQACVLKSPNSPYQTKDKMKQIK